MRFSYFLECEDQHGGTHVVFARKKLTKLLSRKRYATEKETTDFELSGGKKIEYISGSEFFCVDDDLILTVKDTNYV